VGSPEWARARSLYKEVSCVFERASIATAMARKTSLQRQSRYQSLMSGVKEHWSPSGKYVIGGGRYSKAEIIGRLQSVLDSMKETSARFAAWRAQVAIQRTLEKSLHNFVRYLEFAVRAKHGENRRMLAAFGLEPAKKPGPRTAMVKALAAEKAKATRQARGTLGRRQRLKIKGTK
jgi:hypothetical protein